MKHRPAPRPINFKRRLDAKLKQDPQVIKWSRRLLGDPEAKPYGLSEEQLAFVHLEVLRRRNDLRSQSEDLYVKAMHDTTPVLAAPDMDRKKLAEDLREIWSQPEMIRFWKRWEGEASCMGPKPDFMTGKALMAAMGMTGTSAHADDIYAELTGNPEIWGVFESLEGKTAAPRSYQNSLKQMPRLGCWGRAVRCNVAMVRQLAKLLPGQGIGERLMIDGMGMPAWCKQAPKGRTTEQELYRRRLCPEAGYRAYIQNKSGKQYLEGTEKGTAAKFLRTGKAWRGYYLVVIADQATGLPLVWTVMDASINEEGCIVPLLSDLYRHWPDCPAQVIAGDSAWDKDPWCRVCEVDYGIHPIFRLHDEDRIKDVSAYSRDGSVAGISGKGQLICAQHKNELKFVGAELASRAGLAGPGKSSKEGEFRVRAHCRHCGTLSLRMQADWSRLTFYPQNDVGPTAMKRFAFRQAMLTRLNGMEGIFQRLQSGRNLGTKGADRTRIRDKAAHESIISIALMSMTAAALTDQRAQAGSGYPLLPPIPTSSGARAVASKATGSGPLRRNSRSGQRQAATGPTVRAARGAHAAAVLLPRGFLGV